MTQIRFESDGSRIEITCEGHSGYADSGADIVCAAISILVHSFAELSMKLGMEKKITVQSLDLGEGYSHICIYDPREYTGYAVEMIKMGLASLAECYPDNLSIEWGEC